MLFNKGWVRLAHSEYKLEDGEHTNLFRHLTNSSFGKKHKDFKNYKEVLGMTHENFN